MKDCLFFKQLNKRKDKGTTLVEMVVSFTLLAIFVSVSVVIISNVTVLYYRVRGESYARQVGDIITNKVASEISGAQYSVKNTESNFIIESSSDFKTRINDEGKDYTLLKNFNESIDGNVVTLYDRTNTRISVYSSKGIMNILYYPIKDETVDNQSRDREPIIWTFDDKIYNGYFIESMQFSKADSNEYPPNIVVLNMKLKSNKYGEFDICRYIKMYNYPDN